MANGLAQSGFAGRHIGIRSDDLPPMLETVGASSVEALIEGDAVGVESLVDWCRHGPTTAQVEALTVVDEEPHGLVGFTVR